VLILIIALASLFSAILGYSRIPYAAAVNGDFFSVFARVHPKYHFPHISLLAVGGVGFLFSLIFKLSEVITAILTMRILVQFISQAVGVIAWHYKHPHDERPYTMPLFPLPAILSIIIWLFIYSCIDTLFIKYSLLVLALGTAVYFIREKISQRSR
jgi:amino acid transporter